MNLQSDMKMLFPQLHMQYFHHVLTISTHCWRDGDVSSADLSCVVS